MAHKTVLQLTGMTAAKYGALERYFVELARFCQGVGYRAVFQYETTPASDAYVHDLRDAGADITVVRTHGSPLRSIRRVARLIRANRPEIVHAHFVDGYIRLAIPLLARRFGVKRTVFTLHGDPGPHATRPGCFALNLYDDVLAVSQLAASRLAKVLVRPKVVSTHYLGLVGERQRSDELRRQFREEFRIADDAVVFACIAFDHPIKGVDVLLEAFRDIVSDHVDVHLILVGIPQERSPLARLVHELGVTDRVHWAGIRDDGWRVLGAADVYVQPSRSEGMPMAVMEAMALGLPVVASHVGGIPEAVVDGETGYLADGGSVESLRNNLRRMLAARDRWKTIGEAGCRRYRRLFSGDKSLTTLVEYYGLPARPSLCESSVA